MIPGQRQSGLKAVEQHEIGLVILPTWNCDHVEAARHLAGGVDKIADGTLPINTGEMSYWRPIRRRKGRRL
jgi:hypothetical protein